MSVTFLEPGSAATQDLSFFTASAVNNGTVATDTTGGRNIKASVTTVGGWALVETPTSVVSDVGALVSMGMRLSTAAPSTTTMLFAVGGSGFAEILMVGVSPAGTLIIAGRGTTAINGTTVLASNKRYRVSLSYVITSTTSWTAKLYLDGVLEATTTNVDGTLSLVTTTCVQIGTDAGATGFTDFASSSIIDTRYDSIYVDTRTDLTDCGNIRVTAKRPFSNGTTTGFSTQIGAGGSGYGSGHAPQVNEQPLSQTNGWSVINAGSTVTEEYNVEGAAVGDVDLTGVDIVDSVGWILAKALVGETAQLIVNGVSAAIALTSTATLFTRAAGTKTYPGGAGVDVGMTTSATVTTVSLYECGVLIAYTPAASGVRVGVAPAAPRTRPSYLPSVGY